MQGWFWKGHDKSFSSFFAWTKSFLALFINEGLSCLLCTLAWICSTWQYFRATLHSLWSFEKVHQMIKRRDSLRNGKSREKYNRWFKKKFFLCANLAKTKNQQWSHTAFGTRLQKKTQVESKIPISSLLSFLLLNYLLFTPVTSSSTKPRFKNCIGFHAYKQIMLEIGGLKSV